MQNRLRVIVSLAGLIGLTAALGASSSHGREGRVSEWNGRYEAKVGPALRRQLSDTARARRASQTHPVIVRVRRDLFETLEASGPSRSSPNALATVHGYAARLTARQIEELSQSDQVEYVSRDEVIRPAGKPARGGGGGSTESSLNPFTSTLGIAQKFKGQNLTNLMGFDGSGVTVAVLDSGIFQHFDFQGTSRMLARLDFTSGEPLLDEDEDPYGHGTHVAGIIGGRGFKSNGQHTGLAPGVDFVSLRVVGPDGIGLTSNLIRAIDWVIANQDAYGIRVANLSLGHAATESYTDDPLCLAVGRMVEAGIVTVVSAGNLGKTAEYPKIWGAITSPGISPAVITVGAANTRATETQSDDVATTYSSRGPTVDGLFKPDLVAPGNRVPSTTFNTSTLAANYPDLAVDNYYTLLSGTSMATGYVTGTVALMLEANPELTPRMVKAILMLTATKMTEAHPLEQGNGLLNAFTAVELAAAVDVVSQSIHGAVSPRRDLNGETVWAGGAFAFGDQVVYSDLVDSSRLGQLWGDGTTWSEGWVWSDGTVWTDGLFEPESVFWADGFLWSDAFFWTDAFFWSDTTVWSDGFLWSDTFLATEGYFWSDGFFWSDSSLTFDAQGAHDFAGDP